MPEIDIYRILKNEVKNKNDRKKGGAHTPIDPFPLNIYHNLSPISGVAATPQIRRNSFIIFDQSVT